jgi:hypothetical protein
MAELVKGAKDERERQLVIAVMSTGNFDVATDASEDSRIRIERENEQLRDLTQPVPEVLSTDPHDEEITKHAAALNSDNVRRKPDVRKRFEEHIAAHVNKLTPDHPDFVGMPLLTALGQQALPPHSVPAEAAGAMAGGRKGGDKPPKPGGAAPEKAEGGSKPGQAGMPEDPTTGQRMQGAPPPPPMAGG